MRAEQIVEQALAAAGDHQLAVLVTAASAVNLRWARNELTTNGDVRDQQVTVVAMHGAGGTATVTGQVADTGELAGLVGRAPAADAAALVAGGTAADFADPAPAAHADAVAGWAAQLGEQFRAAEADGIELFGYAEHALTTTWLGTTAGTRRRHVQRQDRAEVTAKSHARSRSAWSGTADLARPPEAIVRRLRADLDHQGRPVTVAPGRHRVLLSPSAVADLMIDLYWHADARAALEGRSVFAAGDGTTRIGQRLSSPDWPVRLSSDPFDPAPGMAAEGFVTDTASGDAASVFDAGLPLRRTDWIAGGTLRALLTTRATAAQAGIAVTPGIDNLTLAAGGSGTLDDVAARLDDGLLVTCLWYNRVLDPRTLALTGLTRDGVYVVRGGEIVGACGNFRFNDSPVSVLGRIVDASREERTLAREMGDYFNRAVMPALVVDEFNLSTASEAR